MKTVAEFAKEIGKSTTTVYRTLNAVEQETEKCLTVLNGNIKQITDEGLEVLRDRFGVVEQPVQQMFNDEERPLNGIERPKNAEIEAYKKTIAILENQLREKDEQIKGLIQTSNNLTALTDRQQGLTAGAMASNNPALLADSRSGSESQPSRKRSFFDRFRRPQG